MPSARRASRPTTRAFAPATAACARASAANCRRIRSRRWQVSAPERDALFEQRWAIGGFSLLGALRRHVDRHARQRAVRRIRARQDPQHRARPGRCQAAVPDAPDRLQAPVRRHRLLRHLQPAATSRWSTSASIRSSASRRAASSPAGATTASTRCVLATGFDAFTGPLTRIDLRGRGGLHIRDKWRGGPLNYLGLTVAGFPNLFNLGRTGQHVGLHQRGPCHRASRRLDRRVHPVARCAAGIARSKPSGEAESHWVQRVNQVAEQTVYPHCNSWYLGANIPGKPRIFMPLAGGFPAYADRCAAVARDGYAGFVTR